MVELDRGYNVCISIQTNSKYATTIKDSHIYIIHSLTICGVLYVTVTVLIIYIHVR